MVVALLVLAVVVVLGVQTVRAASALRDAEQDARQLRSELGQGDLAGADATAESFAGHARTARSSTDGVLWTVATRLPLVGADAAAVRAVAAATDDLGGTLPAGLQAAAAVDRGGLRTASGVDLTALADLRPAVEQLADGTRAASNRLADVDPARLDSRIADRVAQARQQVRRLDSGASAAATALRVLPEVLGADGPRSYLLVAQNNAEIRATGGLPGSASVLTADGGAVRLGSQGSSNEVQGDGSPVAEMLPGEREVFGPLLVTDFRDTNFTPDFPRAASLMADFAERAGADRVDGVVSVDPVLLARVLRVTGPVEVDGRRLTADNAVEELLSAPYLRLPPGEAQDAFFRVAARNVLTALLSVDGSQRELVDILTEGVRQRRLLLWSADEATQAQIATSAVAGALPSGTGRPEVGLYLNDGTAAKMQYYLRSSTSLASRGCDADGRQVVRVRLRLTNTLSAPVSSLTDSVTGSGASAPRGDMRMNLRMFAPEGGELVGLDVDGARSEVGRGEVYGRQVSQMRVQLAPGRSTEIVAEFAGRPGETGDARVQWTPGIVWEPTQAVAPSRC